MSKKQNTKPKFLFLRPEEKVPQGLRGLAVADKPVSSTSTILSEAKKLLKIKIQNLGGDTAVGFSVEKTGAIKSNIQYYAPEFVAIGVPALVAAENEPPETSRARKEIFLKNVAQEHLLLQTNMKDADSSKEEGRADFPLPIFVLPFLFVAALLWTIFSA